MRDDKKELRCTNAPPSKEESLKMKGLMVLDIEALIRDAYENLKGAS